MILGRNIEQDTAMCHKVDNFGFLAFVLASPSCLNWILCQLCKTNTLQNIVFEFDFIFALQHEYPSQYFDVIW